MKNLKDFEPTPLNILKATGIFLGGLIILAIAIRLVGFTLSPILENTRFGQVISQSSSKMLGLNTMMGYPGAADVMGFGKDGMMAELSVRNIAPEPYGGTTGDDAEEYEVRDYSVSVESRNLDRDCGVISGLKPLDYVIFESANEYDRGCNYVFKVAIDKVDEILAVIDELDPEDVNENTRTIKQTLDDYTSEEEILLKKLETVTATLDSANVAYDSIAALATRNQDAESLAKIIDSKLDVLERLTRERINITTQLDRLSRSKSQQLDKLDYIYFYVNIIENKFFDGDSIKNSWKIAVKDAIRDINRAVQDMTVSLLVLAFIILQWIIYILIIVVVAKYGWKVVRYIWKK